MGPGGQRHEEPRQAGDVGVGAPLSRARWAALIGIGVTLVAAMINFFWIFVHPLATVVIVTLNVLVAYALTMYGLDEKPTDAS